MLSVAGCFKDGVRQVLPSRRRMSGGQVNKIVVRLTGAVTICLAAALSMASGLNSDSGSDSHPRIFLPEHEYTPACLGDMADFRLRPVPPFMGPGIWNINGYDYEVTRLPPWASLTTFVPDSDPQGDRHYLLTIDPVRFFFDQFQVYASIPYYDDAKFSGSFTVKRAKGPVMTLHLMDTNFGTPGQCPQCRLANQPDRFVFKEGFINSLELGEIKKTSVDTKCQTFDQVLLVNGETTFAPVEKAGPGSILVLVDGEQGPVELYNFRVNKDLRLYVVGIPMKEDESWQAVVERLESKRLHSGSGSGSGTALETYERPVIDAWSRAGNPAIYCQQSECYFENLVFNHHGGNRDSTLFEQEAGILTLQNSEVNSGSGANLLIRQWGEGVLRLLNSQFNSQGSETLVKTTWDTQVCNSHFTCTGGQCGKGLEMKPYRGYTAGDVRHSSFEGFQNAILADPVSNYGFVTVTLDHVRMTGSGETEGVGVTLGGGMHGHLSDLVISDFQTGVGYCPGNRVNIGKRTNLELSGNHQDYGTAPHNNCINEQYPPAADKVTAAPVRSDEPGEISAAPTGASPINVVIKDWVPENTDKKSAGASVKPLLSIVSAAALLYFLKP